MLIRLIISGLVILFMGVCGVTAQTLDETLPFPIYPETTSMGQTMCDLWFWRGEPPCFYTTTMHGAYVRYPTRQKARIIVESYMEDGLYPRELLAAFFGTLMVGSYRPEGVAPIGDFWDSGYFGLVKLDYRVEAKNLLLDVVLQKDWAAGRFVDERYKALNVLSQERLITLREYKDLKQYLTEEVARETMDIHWANALVTALASFKEWNEELLPVFQQVFDRLEPGSYRPVLQAFLDFDVPDDGAFLMRRILEGKVSHLADRELCIRAAYLLDDEFAVRSLNELSESFKADDSYEPEFKAYVVNTLVRLSWFGNWEITDTKMTVDDGLSGERIIFRPKRSLEVHEDEVDFSMPMLLNDFEEMLPIGTDTTYLTNNVSFEITPDTLRLLLYKPSIKSFHIKVFTIKEGTGRNAGKIYLQFPLDGELEGKGKDKIGWVEIEKVS
ncbi:hypothetical protein JXA80_01715 [bacterium]|nr:hypothetical protein [candidate division CSSED10-310 bacterium]